MRLSGCTVVLPENPCLDLLRRPVLGLVCLLMFALAGCGGGWGTGGNAPVITAQPSSQSVSVGQTATFSVTATGTAPLAYQWLRGGAAIAGATGVSYTTAATALTDNGAGFTVKVSNAFGSVTSTTASLTVSGSTVAPAITVQPASVNVCVGATASLSVTATNAGTYQWSRNASAVSGATLATYTIAGAQAAQTGSYTVTVTNNIGSVTSAVATVTVGSSIVANPANLSVAVTQTAEFAVSANGVGPFAYQWYVLPSGATTGTAISGATLTTYTTPAVTATSNGSQYYVTVTDSCGTVATSTRATLTVTSGNVPPTIIVQPASQSAAVGSTPTFTVSATGSPTLSYQWYQIPAGSTSGNALSGATSTSYTLPATATTTSNDQDQYYVIVTNPYGQAVSVPATLAVGAGILIQIGHEPVTQYVNAGAPASFSVSATSTVPLAYQWYAAAPGTSGFTAISGATSATYNIASTTLSQYGTVFYVTVSNGSTTSVNSSTAALFVGPLAGISSLCSSTWSAIGNATLLSSTAPCSFQLTDANGGEHGEIVWPNLIATGNIQLTFTVAIANPSDPPADGFSMVLGDPSLGATPTSLGNPGEGLSAEGIPGFVVGFDTFLDPGDPPVPYLGVGRSDAGLWENPWTYVNTNIPALAVIGSTVTHTYVITIVQGAMTVTMDGAQLFSGKVTVPPVAYLYLGASTGAFYEQHVISNLTATVAVP